MIDIMMNKKYSSQIDEKFAILDKKNSILKNSILQM